ncbi:cupin domain-containing protein (plasmid) [Pantoea agglomerans pv. betae]|jgi:uncharacterized RmlC-like cupin family protein|uniref:cupin domain-containing protein n=1 Tax=Enterobacter agglomerans TaxID=549 RepID=UPI0007E532AC|nr:cupin domain-containing protein [Pantoea agglomerans]WHU82410.1 cupin domain-containing protein [Pantoea agglomerans pv. betae]WHU90643.1 cupin domain-containing protein [Pantoea agglomerans pv. gypsophilae]
MNDSLTCHLIYPGQGFEGKQGLKYYVGISKETVGSSHLHMQLAMIPPNSQGKAHLHEHHETAIYALEGITWIRFGHRLENELEVPQGSFLYIPAGLPHLPFNISESTATLVIARTDPSEQESVTLLPHLDINLM